MRTISALLLFSVLVSAQNTITVTANRATSVQPDQIVFSADLYSDPTASRDDVLAVLSGSLLSAANFSTVRAFYQTSSSGHQTASLNWSFSVTAPLANFKDTTAQLTALQQAVALKENGMSLSFSIYGMQTSPQAQQACSNADLLSDARAQALKMASAAGMGVGSVIAMSGAAVSQAASGGLFSTGTLQPSCSLTVKFALTGF
jgi:hypothetical protein